MLELKRNSKGYFEMSDLKNLEPQDLLKLLIKETSHQETLNIVRSVAFDFENKLNKLNK